MGVVGPDYRGIIGQIDFVGVEVFANAHGAARPQSRRVAVSDVAHGVPGL